MSILDPISREDRILAAGLAVFGRYGFKRASMADIAEEAGISRPLLYLSFANKAAIFLAVAEALASALATAGEAAWPPGAGVEQGLPALVEAHFAPLVRLIRTSPHGPDLIGAGSPSLSDLHQAMQDRLAAFLETRLQQLSGPAAGPPALLARTLVNALHGLKEAARDEADLLAQARLLACLAAGTQSPAAPASGASRS